MAVHLCRDLLLVNSASDALRTNAYIAAIFMRRVLKFAYVGCTGLKIQTTGESGTLLIATGDSAPATQSGTWNSADKVAINLGSGLEYRVAVPVGTYTVNSADVGRLLVLRSTTNPKHNSGVFRITGYDAANNRWTIDYRSSEYPPAEAAGSLEWYLYKSDSEITWPTTGSAQPYAGWGSGTNYRIILQSPHATAWQIRICGEPNTECNARMALVSYQVGYGGDSNGDFAPGGLHTHLALYNNGAGPNWSTTWMYATSGGLGGMNITSGGIYRVNIEGDDTGQAVLVAQRIVTHPSDDQTGHVLFGIPDSEPDTVMDHQRLFVIGDCLSACLRSLNYIGVDPVSSNGTRGSRGQAISFGGIPITACYGAFCYSGGNSVNANPAFDSNASDSVFSSTTELLTLDVVSGTWRGAWGYDQTYAIPMPYEPRVMGTAPYIRQGRANFGDYTLTTNKSWYHLRYGLYLRWDGPAVLA